MFVPQFFHTLYKVLHGKTWIYNEVLLGLDSGETDQMGSLSWEITRNIWRWGRVFMCANRLLDAASEAAKGKAKNRFTLTKVLVPNGIWTKREETGDCAVGDLELSGLERESTVI